MAHIGVENWLTVQHLSELFDKVWGSRVTFRPPFSSISEVLKDPHFFHFDENIFVFFDKVRVWRTFCLLCLEEACSSDMLS